MGTALRRAQRKADKRQALDSAPDQQAARKEKARGAVAMTRPGDTSGDFHKPQNLTVGAILKHANRRHLVTSF